MPNISHSFVLRVMSSLILMPVVLFALFYGGTPFLLMMFLGLFVAYKEWFQMAKLSPHRARDMVWGFVYITFSIFSFMFLRLEYHGGEWLAIALMLCVWASDSGAYFSGKFFGGAKMAPSISPNKTWAGLIGGVISSAMGFYAFAKYIGPAIGKIVGKEFDFLGFENSSLTLLLIGMSITLSGQVGDLLISKQKRIVGVKDTGNIIPGHGGLLDRVDSLMMASLIFVATILVLKP